jgi:hypothetical protein
MTLFVCGASANAVEITSRWTGNGTTNRWAEPANWDPVGVPNDGGGNTYHVIIDDNASAAVNIDLDLAPINIQTLTIDAGDTLSIKPPGTLNVRGGLLQLDGTIRINPLNATGVARLIFPEDCLLRGPGEVLMEGQPGRCTIQVGSNDTLTIGETPAGPGRSNPTVRGQGVFTGGTVVNNSTIRSDFADGTLIISFMTMINNAVIQAVGAVLSEDFSSVDQSGGGTTAVDGSDAHLGVTQSDILGGRVTITGNSTRS